MKAVASDYVRPSTIAEALEQIYAGSGELGGLIAGVGQRVLRGISKRLIASFFKSARSELEGGR